MSAEKHEQIRDALFLQELLKAKDKKKRKEEKHNLLYVVRWVAHLDVFQSVAGGDFLVKEASDGWLIIFFIYWFIMDHSKN